MNCCLHAPLTNYLAAVLLLVATPAYGTGEDDGGFVKSGQTLRDLRGEQPPPGASVPQGVSPSEEWLNTGSLLRLVGLMIVVLSTLGVLMVFGRRRLRLAAGAGGRRLEIVDKLALSRRHWVCVLRVDGKRLVVGVSGDNMSSLAVLEDGPPPVRGARESSLVRGEETLAVREYPGIRESGGTKEDFSLREAASSIEAESTRNEDGTFWFRPARIQEGEEGEEGEEDEGGESRWENHLAPYRREVNRLRAMLQNWRENSDERASECGASAQPVKIEQGVREGRDR